MWKGWVVMCVCGRVGGVGVCGRVGGVGVCGRVGGDGCVWKA